MRKVPQPSSREDDAPPREGVEVAESASAEVEVGARLCRAVASGDGRAFAELVERFQHRIYAFCRRMIGDAQEAEDLAQDVFLTVYRNAGEFRGDSSFSTWLYRIARNQTLNRIKYLDRRGRNIRSSLDEVGEDRLGSERRSPLELVEGQQTATLVQEAIARLPEQQRTVLVLRDLEGLSYEEIVDITGLAQGTVKSRIHRARSALADRLARTLE
ncbi:MAG: sigma-70 family RNA polymerase sigma factor [Myxococcota bacterium]